MVTMHKSLCYVTVLAMLSSSSLALDPTLRNQVLNTYRGWFPQSRSIHYQRVDDNERVLDHLRLKADRLSLIEMEATLTHRNFLAPLRLRNVDRDFGLVYGNNKNYFAAFQMPWSSSIATFEGIGAINGVSSKHLADKLAETVFVSTPENYGVVLHIP